MMTDHNNCPICNKPGILNFLAEDVVCPCCGSDLSVYRGIEMLANSYKKKNLSSAHKWLIAISLLSLALLFGNIWLYSSQCKVAENLRQMTTSLDDLKKKNATLSDSISEVKKASVINLINEKESKESQWYKIKKGDSFCRISKRLYGTEMKYEDIVKLNNLTESTLLHPGDSLRIR